LFVTLQNNYSSNEEGQFQLQINNGDAILDRWCQN